MSQTKVIALLLLGVLIAFDIADAGMSPLTILLLVGGWGYVLWQGFLRGVMVAGVNKARTFELTVEGKPIDWLNVFVYLLVYLAIGGAYYFFGPRLRPRGPAQSYVTVSPVIESSPASGVTVPVARQYSVRENH
jgi:hypothetical protein